MTDDAPLLPPESKPWPPREGMRFFLLWSAGVLSMAIINRAMTYANPNLAPDDRGMQVVWLLGAVAGSSWHAWLLFPVSVRFFVWVAGAVLMTVLNLWIYSLGHPQWAQHLEFVSAVVQIALLTGVRRRPWLVVPATLVRWLLTSAGNLLWIVYYNRWSTWLAGQLPAGISSAEILTSVYFGIWLLGQLLHAAVLAWWMPPVVRPDAGTERLRFAPNDD